MRKLIILVVWTAVISGCTSLWAPATSDFTKAPLLGIVHNTEGAPLQGVKICIDSTSSVFSDSGGRFIIPPTAKGLHYFTFEKGGYETLKTKLNFTDPAQMIYTQLTSLDNLITELTEALKEEKLKAAESLLTRASVAEADSDRLKYLKAVYFVKMVKYQEAASLIEDLIKLYPQESALVLTLNKIKIIQGGINEY